MKRCLVLCLALLLAGCQRVGQNSRTQPVATTDEKAATESKSLRCTKGEDVVELEAVDNVLQHQNQTYYISLESLGAAEDAGMEALSEAVNSMLADSYGNLEGVTASGKIMDGKVQVNISIDFTKTDIKELIQAGLMQEGEADADFVQLQTVETDLENGGFACQ